MCLFLYLCKEIYSFIVLVSSRIDFSLYSYRFSKFSWLLWKQTKLHKIYASLLGKFTPPQFLFHIFKGRFLSKHFSSILSVRLGNEDWAGKLIESNDASDIDFRPLEVPTTLSFHWATIWERTKLNAPCVCSVSTLQTGLVLYKYMDLYGEGQTQGLVTCLLLHFAIDSASHSLVYFWDTCKQCVELIKCL